MGKFIATQEHIDFAVKNCKTWTENAIDMKFGTSKGVTKRILEKRGLRLTKEESCRLRADKCRRILTKKEINYIKKHVASKSLREIAAYLKCGKALVTAKCHELGFQDVLKNKEANSRFSKGHIPYYKGKRIPEEMKERIKHTYFQKGNIPHNTKSDGSVSPRMRKGGQIEMFYRVSMSNWIPMRHKVWQDHYGEIPKKMNIIFKNGNMMDYRIENLEMISNYNLMLRNSIHSYPKELVLQIHKLAKLKRIINKKTKENESNI